MARGFRLLVFSNIDYFLSEIDPSTIYSLKVHEEINGEHRLDIETSTQLERGQRIVGIYGTSTSNMSNWREWVVTSFQQEHGKDGVIGRYTCVWGLQYDLMTTATNAMPGVQSPVNARDALDAVLENSRYIRGAVDDYTTLAGASMYRTTAWDALATLIKTWGGEVSVSFNAPLGGGSSQAPVYKTEDWNTVSGIYSRSVNIRSRLGSTTPKRFEYGSGLVGVKRSVESDTWACRVIPLGKGEESESGGYGRKITIESVNGGRDYLTGSNTVDVWTPSRSRTTKTVDGSDWYVQHTNSYNSPIKYIENSNMETPADLKAWAERVLEEETKPKVSYVVDIDLLHDSYDNYETPQLGDAIQCIDPYFSGGGLAIDARIVAVDIDLLNPSNTKVTIGNATRYNRGIITTHGRSAY